MPRGQPDYGQYQVETYGAGLADMAELAARLDSIVVHDRRGRVVLLDNFEATLIKWNVGKWGAASAVLDSTYPRSGSQDVRLRVLTAADFEVWMIKGIHMLPSPRIGSEVSICRASTNTYFEILIECYDGVTYWQAGVRLDFNGNALSYYNTAGGWTPFATTPPFVDAAHVLTPVKLVVDFSTGRYVRFILGYTEYDLTAYIMDFVGSGLAPYIRSELKLVRRAGVDSSIYLDDYILTQEEP